MLAELIVELQIALVNPQSYSPEQLKELAKKYSLACELANDRVRTCLGLIRQGFLSEAIRLADLDPNLLDEMGSLHFRGRQQWLAISRKIGFEPVELVVQAAKAISNAYDTHEKIKHLAAEFRRQNLLNSPAHQRISTLKNLITLDPHNIAWRSSFQAVADAVR